MTKKDFSIDTNEAQEDFYCLIGQEDFSDSEQLPRSKEDDSKVCAKRIQNKKSKHFEGGTIGYRYYIKISPELILFNPIKLNSSVKDKPKFHHINKICKSEWIFKEVDFSIFNKYLNFLKTSDIKWLKDAERQLQ